MASASHSGKSRGDFLKLAIGALGIVYGDIGTSPLYSMKECFAPGHGLEVNPHNVYGILSLIFWTLMLVVVLKYLVNVLRADNRGEGGTIALLALLLRKLTDKQAGLRTFLAFLGLFGVSLLYGEGIITPAITVLSAIEGLSVATHAFDPYVVPITVAILLGVFTVQSRGTARIGAIFGPVTLIWFVAIAAAGVPWILRHPEILYSVNPLYAFRVFSENGLHGFLILGSVVLCITGAEALYADMGHFGKGPIRLSWFTVVFPCLLLNYFGQGALLLERGAESVKNPFYDLIPSALLYPMVVLASAAAVIASQALISGAFSITQQAMQIGYLPRLSILHTSRDTHGQIFIPRVNSLLMFGSVGLVLLFQKSTHLAAAYGIAVTGTMTISSILFYHVARLNFGWSKAKAGSLVALFLVVDLTFFSANLVKILSGGWIPVVIALGTFTLMTTWKRGRDTLSKSMMMTAQPMAEFFKEIEKRNPPRVKGTAIFMTLNRDVAPPVLLHHYRHNHLIHEQVVLLSIVTEGVPDVSGTERVRVTDLEHGFVKAVARYGFMEAPDIQEIIGLCAGSGLPLDMSKVSFFLGRETYMPTGESKMARWRKRFFILMSRNARSATEFFNIPPDKVIEIGSQIRL